ncbi:hypothetical protein [Luteibacter aegosomatissinici]|uniref:hypothetical protein n=1 Tax=Luteibacter aegosomatissinici TaxID=2911539 RepID=UPI001FF9EAF9|nr:hypothetical protein [Luteibacter aegosomatissinici]UPG95019.1 hypothetical protein L2Y97_02615 [Luteibacter aegosomatissinici]
MVDDTWHMDALGLPAHADILAVRRAYAARLRGMDAEMDPAGFQRLRHAYEAALAWCEAHAADTDAGDIATPPTPAAPVADESPGVEVTTDTSAADALGKLSLALAGASTETVPTLLDGVVASLRHGYIDAPGQFEDLLIDALQACAIPRRHALFDAATHAFHWHEVGRLRASDPRATWIARVLSQAEDWLSLDAGWRSTWLALLERAQGGVDDYTARRWPDIGRLRERIPDWLTLHLTPAQLRTWQDAFERLPRSTREEYLQRAAPDAAIYPRRSAGTRRRDRFRLPPLAWAITWFALMLFYLIANGIFTANKNHQGEPLPDFSDKPLTPRECMALYARLDAPDAFAGMPANDVVQAKRRAQRCALDGHWRAPGGINGAPRP